MLLGGFATSRSPLAAVAARGAEDNINDVGVASTDVILELQCLCLISLLLRTTDTLSLAIRDLETFLYSPLRGNILGRASFSQYGEPAKLCQSKSATTSSAQSISTSDADKPPQKCV